MCDALAGNGHDVHLLATQGAAGSIDLFYGTTNQFAVTLLRRRRRFSRVLRLFDMRRAMSDRAADLIYARSIQAALIGIAQRRPVVYEVHAPPSTLPRLLAERTV